MRKVNTTMDKLDDVNTDVELLSAAIIKLQEENAYLERSLAQAQVEYLHEQQYVEDMITQWDLGASQLTGLIRDNKKNDKYIGKLLDRINALEHEVHYWKIKNRKHDEEEAIKSYE